MANSFVATGSLKGVLACTVALASAAYAAETPKSFAAPAATAAPGNMTNIGQVTLSLLVVLAAIFAVAWMLRRMRMLNRRGARNLEVVAELMLGAKERAVLVRAGKKHVLLGVTQTQVSALHVLDADDLENNPVDYSNPSAPSTPSFKALLRQSLGMK